MSVYVPDLLYPIRLIPNRSLAPAGFPRDPFKGRRLRVVDVEMNGSNIAATFFENTSGTMTVVAVRPYTRIKYDLKERPKQRKTHLIRKWQSFGIWAMLLIASHALSTKNSEGMMCRK